MEWTLRRLVAAAGVPAELSGDAPVRSLAYDSRAVRPGALFCCVPGARTDGHDHAAAAVAAGAAALVVERWLPLPVPQARVRRVREVLGPLASAFFGHPSRALRVAGVTGTNGKTTVAYLVHAMAEAAGMGAALIGTVERVVGGEVLPAPRTTPEAPDLQELLARAREAGAEVVGMEVTSEGLDQRRVDGTRFACVAFTNLSPDHLNYHGTMEAYFEAKARLFDGSFSSRAVVNAEDAWGRRLLARARGLEVLTFGFSRGDVRCEGVEPAGGGSAVTVRTPGGRVRCRTALPGRHNVENVLCAAAIAIHLGLPGEAVAAGVERLRGIPGRLERVEAGQPFTVLVDYAHTPHALAAALRAAREMAGGGKVIVVFGCGGDRDRGKRPLMGRQATALADLTVVTSDNPRSEEPEAIIADILPGCEAGGGEWRVEPDRRAAIALALAEARPGDVVLVAGKGHETGQVFADRTVPFDDRVVVRELLEGVHA